MPVFVIEMNNSTNKIEGIGLIKNKPETARYYKVHQDGNTNRYIYIGNYFLDCKTIQEYDSQLVCILEEILFKGYTHSKRGQGLTLIPEKVLKYWYGENCLTECQTPILDHITGEPIEATNRSCGSLPEPQL